MVLVQLEHFPEKRFRAFREVCGDQISFPPTADPLAGGFALGTRKRRGSSVLGLLAIPGSSTRALSSKVRSPVVGSKNSESHLAVAQKPETQWQPGKWNQRLKPA